MADDCILSVSNLPEDIFMLILDYLSAPDVLRCQHVSREWRVAFCKDTYLQSVLRRYPKAREIRQILEELARSFDSWTGRGIDWTTIFGVVATRYHHLASGRARSVKRFRLRALDQSGHWYPVGQWDYHESQPGGRLYHENAAAHLRSLGGKPYLFRPTLWSYDDGLLVHPSISTIELYASPRPLLVIDLETDVTAEVPFDITGRQIRNLRLKERTLIIEWAEKEPFHGLNLIEKVHRHFATCYDVVSGPARKTLKIIPRSEWKTHFLGLPLSSRDYFFSTHTKSHYAWYLWQPNRSLWTGDEDMPIEALCVWDISEPSKYLPSKDPTNRNRPQSAEGQPAGPHMVTRFSFRELEHIGIRQHGHIALLSMSLDCQANILIFRENKFESGQGYFDPAERTWRSCATSFPFLGQGPCLVRRDYNDLPPYRGHCSMETTTVEESEKWFLPIMDVIDEEADIRFSLVETCFTGQLIENKVMARVKVHDKWVNLAEDVANEIGAMGRIAGDERWIIGQNSRMELVVAKFQ